MNKPRSGRPPSTPKLVAAQRLASDLDRLSERASEVRHAEWTSASGNRKDYAWAQQFADRVESLLDFRRRDLDSDLGATPEYVDGSTAQMSADFLGGVRDALQGSLTFWNRASNDTSDSDLEVSVHVLYEENAENAILDLVVIAELELLVEAAKTAAVVQARMFSIPWAAIGQRFGVSASAVQQKYLEKVDLEGAG